MCSDRTEEPTQKSHPRESTEDSTPQALLTPERTAALDVLERELRKFQQASAA